MKNLFTSLAICLVLSLLMVNCTEQDEPQNIEVIQAELDAFIRSEMGKSDGNMTPKLKNFLAEKGFVEITLETHPEAYEQMELEIRRIESQISSQGRIQDCTVTGSGMMDGGGGCRVAVYEYSSDCYNAGCVELSWWCDGVHQGNAMYC